MPVKAGKAIAKTSMNGSPPSMPPKIASGPSAVPGSGEPVKKRTRESASTAPIPQRKRTPTSAPRSSASSATAAVAGSETQRTSNGIRNQLSSSPDQGRNASAKPIM